jgi:4-hydroxymandelate oxidase
VWEGAAAAETAARASLRPEVFDWIACGSGDELTVAANTSAWHDLRLRPHVLRDVTNVDISCSLLGTVLPMPIAIAPTSRHDLCDPEGEIATARGAAAAGALFAVATGSERTLQEISTAAAGAPRWFQVYMARDRGWTRERVQEAVEVGCSAVVLTADVPVVSRRRSTGAGFVDAGRVRIELDPSVGLDAIAWLGSISGLPVVVKGLLRADDAERCVAAGAAGLIVSNHGGRQLDGAVATARALPAVVAAVGQAAEVYVDGGVRRGTDVLKALALGAKSIFLGRPVLWGLAAGGAPGVEAVLRGFAEELELAMRLAGCTSLRELDSDLLAVV